MRQQAAYVESFAMKTTYGFGQEFHIIEELYYIFVFSKIKYSRYQVSHKRRSQQLHLTISQLTTQIWIMFFRYPQVLSLRFELSSQQTQNQVEHKVVTKHMKEINRATNYSSSQQGKHTPCLLHILKEKYFWYFSKFCKFLFVFSYAIFYGFSDFAKFYGFHARL